MGATIRTTLDKLPGLLAAREKAVVKAIVLGARRGAERARKLMVSKTPVDNGLLKASWKVIRSKGAGGQLAELVNDAPYAGIVEMGARPHAVSQAGREALYEWARRHFGYTVVGGKSQKMKAIAADDDGEKDPFLDSVVWGICKRLAAEGQKPTYFVRNNLEDARELMAEEVERAIDDVSKDSKGSA